MKVPPSDFSENRPKLVLHSQIKFLYPTAQQLFPAPDTAESPETTSEKEHLVSMSGLAHHLDLLVTSIFFAATFNIFLIAFLGLCLIVPRVEGTWFPCKDLVDFLQGLAGSLGIEELYDRQFV